MVKKKTYEPRAVVDRSGGVNISGSSQVRVGGDIVGRDKLEVDPQQELNARVSRLIGAINTDPQLDGAERDRLLVSVHELKSEIAQPSPNLSKIQALKEGLIDKGSAIAAATGAIFQYGPVQDALKAAVQRLLGG